MKKNSFFILAFFPLFFLFSTTKINAQLPGTLWGMTTQGGISGQGVLFKYNPVTDSQTVVQQFGYENGNNGKLIQGFDGNFYGVTYHGGNAGYGTLFKRTPAGVVTVLHHFTGTNFADGSYPVGLMQSNFDGYLYGTTYSGGAYNKGTVFCYTDNGTYLSLQSFGANAADGAYPKCGLVQGNDRYLYGVTAYGGSSGVGTLFRCNDSGRPNVGAIAILHHFGTTPDDALYPSSPLIQGLDGDLYGTSSSGGTNYSGTIFKCNTSGDESIVYSFGNGSTDGSIPKGTLVQDASGMLYGTTINGGTDFVGTIFQCSTTGSESVVYNFSGTDGTPYNCDLIKANNGKYYGTTFYGGSSQVGTIFSYDPFGGFSTEYSFIGGSSDGASPGSLLQGADGNLYGLTTSGGSAYSGTIFSFALNGVETVLYNFTDNLPGSSPQGSLIYGNDGYFYGLTESGGSFGHGTIFKCNRAGQISVLHNFEAGVSDGSRPMGTLVMGSDGNLYGFTQYGGALYNGSGVIFKCTTTGTYTVLHIFSGPDGAVPQSKLVEGSDGNFYGMTLSGGANGKGTIFRCSPSGTFTSLYSFAGAPSDGQAPFQGCALILANDGNLYGTTAAGGTYDNGMIFSFTYNGVLSVLHSFAGGNSDGEIPTSSLVQGSDGNLYGTTFGGGAHNNGTIYKCSLSGVTTLLHSFNTNANGGFIINGIMQAGDGKLYGMTAGGGSGYSGLIYSCTTTGTYKIEFYFSGENGNSPFGDLIEVDRPPALLDQAFSVAENSLNNTIIGTVSASVTDGNSISYSIISGNTGNVFVLNSNTGVLTVNGPLDYETISSYSLKIQATNDGFPELKASATVTITVTDVNELPTISDQSFGIDENSTTATTVGTIVASDIDVGQTLSYSIISGNTGNAFAINSSSGVITVAGTLDYETISSYTLTVQVTDNGSPALNKTAQVTINLNDINNEQTPVISPQSFSIAENSSSGTIIGTVTASDADAGQTLTYAIVSGNTDNVFTLNSSTGVLSVVGVLDYETLASNTLTVSVSDNGSPILSSSAVVTITIDNVNEAPVISPQSFSVAENSSIGTLIGTVTASDVDAGQTLTYAIVSGNTDNVFTLNSSTGVLSVAGALDYETLTSYTLTVSVSDNGSVPLTSTALVQISIQDLVETGISSAIHNSEILLYPNPAVSQVSITVEGEASVRLLDLSGQLIKEQNLQNSLLNLQGLNAGTYLLEITRNNQKIIKKLVVE